MVLYLVLWSFKSLLSCWWNIFQLISELTGVLVCPNPTQALLNLRIKNFLPNYRNMVIHIVLAVRTTIVRHLRSQLASNPSEAVMLVKNKYLYESSLSYSTMLCQINNGNPGASGPTSQMLCYTVYSPCSLVIQ